MLEAHVFDISRIIQLAVAPVFLLTAVGTLINALINRLGRSVDRRRQLEELVPAMEGETRQRMLDELYMVARRVRLTLWSIAFAVTSALLVCLLISFAFVGAFITVDLARTVAALFIGSMGMLTLSLLLFLREVFLAAMAMPHPASVQGFLDERK
ncbi:hypothetical protein BWI17_10780 [Betaproteobacteria bacterium GR16-43]|nr:hypothetical protein BWI17_10780 [Betaproteobacteria bacterium GR16-43]